jgi:hypothetical protein
MSERERHVGTPSRRQLRWHLRAITVAPSSRVSAAHTRR